MFNLRVPKLILIFQTVSFPNENFDFVRNIFFGLVTIMKQEFPTSEAVLDGIWALARQWTRTHAHRQKVWCSTNWADQALLKISTLSGGNTGSAWAKKQTNN